MGSTTESQSRVFMESYPPTVADIAATDREGKSDRQDEEQGKTSSENTSDGDDVPGPKCGTRHTLVWWAFLGLVNLYIIRVDVTITLVAMVTQNASHPSLNASESDCSSNDSTGNIDSPSNEKAEFQWDNTIQGLILSAFYYGYFVTQIPGSFLTNRIGGKKIFVIAMAGGSVLALLTPISARLHPGVLIANRVVQGCLQGLVFPSTQMLLYKWVPGKERSRLVAFTYAGCQAGTVIGTLSAGYISDSAVGWPFVFYVEGTLGLLWCVAWMVFVFDTPHDHPRISDPEKNYIRHHVGNTHKKAPETPWRCIMTSPALYAITGAHFANDWGCFAVMTCLPKFMQEVLNYDLSQNGFLSSLPYLVMWVSNLVAGTLADCLRKPNRLKTVHVRKLMVIIGLLGPAALLLVSSYVPGCDGTPLVGFLTAAMGLSGFTMAGHSVNHLDIAPVFAGLLFAITNTVGTTSGWIGPALATYLTDHSDKRDGWQRFFFVSGGVYMVGGFLFVLFARGEVQTWADLKDTEREIILPSPSYGSTQAQDDHVTDESD